MVSGPLRQDEWLTPVEAQRAIGISASRLKAITHAGQIAVHYDHTGVRKYRRTDVNNLIERRANSIDPRVKRAGGTMVPGDIAAVCFECFELGWNLSAIVQHTKLAPTTVRALHLEWSTPLGQPSPTAQRFVRRSDKGRAPNPLEALLEPKRRERGSEE